MCLNLIQRVCSCNNSAQHRQYGLCGDEFLHNNNFPPQLYVREARRLIGLSRLTERSLVPVVPNGRPPLAHDAVAVGSFAIDSFPCTERLPVGEITDASSFL